MRTKEEALLDKIYERAEKGLKKKIKKQDMNKVVDLDYDYQAAQAYNYLKVYAIGKEKRNGVNQKTN